jgi:hypothetical protein
MIEKQKLYYQSFRELPILTASSTPTNAEPTAKRGDTLLSLSPPAHAYVARERPISAYFQKFSIYLKTF